MARNIHTLLLCCLLTIAQPDVYCREAALALNLDNPDRSQDHVLGPYMIALRKRIEHVWHPVSSVSPKKIEIRFFVRGDGERLQMTVEESSGDQLLDDSAKAAIDAAAPFPPVPSNTRRVLNILATFDSRNFRGVPATAPQQRTSYDRGGNEFGNYRRQTSNDTRSDYGDSPRYGQNRSSEGSSKSKEEWSPPPLAPQRRSTRRERDLGADSSPDTDEASRESAEEELKAEAGLLNEDPLSFRLKTAKELSTLSERERGRYQSRLDRWLTIPPEKRFGMLISGTDKFKQNSEPKGIH